jgi:hypothetical protein
MQRTLLLALAGAALLCGLAWLAWPGRGAGRAAELPARVPATAGAPTRAPTRGELAQRAEAQRSAVALDAALQTAMPPGIRIVVVDSAGAAVSGVPVGLAWKHSSVPLMRVVAEAATDTAGLASLEPPADAPRMEGVVLVAAVLLPGTPALEHELAPPTRDAEVRFTLPDAWRAWLEPLTVRVEDSAGQGVSGVSITLQSLLPEHAGTSGNHYGRFVTEGPDGSARIDRGPLIDDLRQARSVGTRLAFELVVEGPYGEPPRRVLAEDELGPETPEVVLVLPDTGRVEVEVEEANGRALDGPATARLRWRARAEDGFQGMHDRAVAAGRAVFDAVGLGLELELEAWPADDGVESGRARLRGPTRPGESVQAVLALGAPRPVLVGRLMDAAGAPAGGLRFQLSFHGVPRDLGSPSAGPSRVDPSYHTSDPDGGFRVLLVRGTFGPRQVEIEESAPRSGAPRGWIARFARADLPDPLAAGQIIDLGKLTLAETPLLVAGRVVDARGAPVAGAWLSFEYPLGEGDAARWFNLPGPRPTSDAAGAFELHQLLPVPLLRVGALSNGIGVAAPVTVPPGSAELRLVLLPEQGRPEGRLLGRVLLDEGLDPTLLEARCEHASGEAHESYVIAGFFGFERLPAGEVVVEIRTRTTDWLVARVAGVQVLADRENRDARLDALDLRGELRYLRLRLVAPDGRPLAGILVWLRTGGEGGSALKTDAGGRLVALTRVRDTSFELTTNEFEPLHVLHAHDEQELVLSPKGGR